MRGHATKTAPAPSEAGAHPKAAGHATHAHQEHPLPNHTAVAHVFFVVAVIILFCYVAEEVMLPIMLAWVICLTLKPVVKWLHKLHLPMMLASALVVAVAVGIIGTGIVQLGRPALDWVQSAPQNIPRMKEKFQHYLSPILRFSNLVSRVGSMESAESPSGNKPPPQTVAVKEDSQMPTSLFSWTGSILAGIGETIALLFLLLSTGDLFVHKLVKAMPTFQDKKRALDISHEIQQHISRYLLSVGIINLCLGTLVAIGLALCGMSNAMMWGGVAALLNFVPYFGPIVGVITVALAGLFAFDTLGQAVLPAVIYLTLHLCEANAITPFVLGRRFRLNPVVIFISLIFFIWLWGVIGALLAVPLLVTIWVICERIPSLSALADFLSE